MRTGVCGKQGGRSELFVVPRSQRRRGPIAPTASVHVKRVDPGSLLVPLVVLDEDLPRNIAQQIPEPRSALDHSGYTALTSLH